MMRQVSAVVVMVMVVVVVVAAGSSTEVMTDVVACHYVLDTDLPGSGSDAKFVDRLMLCRVQTPQADVRRLSFPDPGPRACLSTHQASVEGTRN